MPTIGTEILERINEKKKRLGLIQQKIKEKSNYSEQLQKLETERVNLLREYNNEWQNIQSQRENIIGEIDEKSSRDIKALLKRNSDRAAFKALLHEIADSVISQSNKIISKESQLNLIANSVTPQELLAIVKRGDAGELVQSSGVTQNTASLILSMGLREIHKLETCLLHDVFEVSYKKEGDEVFTPIDHGLSGGEQALALVSVAMISKEFPLLIDQPEDELGPALITQNLVEQIRQVKSNRQLIFVTHVPNIPVLADSEMIAYVIQDILPDGKKSRIEKLGSLEDRDIVKRLLELDGGTRAFQQRSERYSLVIETEE
jgi:DNA repair ATPase RecN